MFTAFKALYLSTFQSCVREKEFLTHDLCIARADILDIAGWSSGKTSALHVNSKAKVVGSNPTPVIWPCPLQDEIPALLNTTGNSCGI